MRRALAIDEASYGPDHPDVAPDLNNLASLLQATNRLGEAEPLSRRYLEILLSFTRKTGHEHPHLRAVIKNYRVCFRRWDGARRRSRRGWRRLAIRSGFGRVPGRSPKMHRAPDNRPPGTARPLPLHSEWSRSRGSSLRPGPRFRALGVSAVRSLRNPTSAQAACRGPGLAVRIKLDAGCESQLLDVGDMLCMRFRL